MDREHTLAVRITRRGWEEALANVVLTSPERRVHRDPDDWRRRFAQATVHVQWDPERSLRGQSLDHRSIQVGLSRHIIPQYVEEWIVQIQDHTPPVRKMHGLLRSGDAARVKLFLPDEAIYPISDVLKKRLGM